MSTDSESFVLRSHGISAAGIRDQYADGKAARVWEYFIGDRKSRTDAYRNFLVDLLRSHGCKRILDVACGTGVDSQMLIEEGFEVVSCDASDKMLKYALKCRWNRRKEPAFDNWIIEEANWLTLYEDIKPYLGHGFDAVICLGNSFAHLTNSEDDQYEHKLAIKNFEKCIRPGGLLLIDHRNYDHIMESGNTPSKSIYYNSSREIDIKTSLLVVSGKPKKVILDYFMDTGDSEPSEFRLSYYPHRLEVFKEILKGIFGHKARHDIYGDFKELQKGQNPAFYIHVIEKLK